MNIVVLAGGLSTERDVSFKTGAGMADALRRLGHKAILLDAFLGYGDEECDITGFFERDVEVSCEAPDIPKTAPDLDRIKSMRKDDTSSLLGPNVIALCRAADMVFIGLHGANGEDGRIQAVLDLYGVKYSGSNYKSCAVCMDKNMTKKILAADGIPVPEGTGISRKNMHMPHAIPKPPFVVKPASGGSSIGMSIVRDPAEYDDAIKLAFSTDDEIVVEQLIEGREFTVGVLGGEALPSVEAVPVTGNFDYANKYAPGATVETCPADVSPEVEKKLRELAVRSANAVGMEVYCRVDIMQNETTGELFVLEVNALPGMTPTSFIPQEAAAIGLNYEQLVDRILELSLDKYR